MKSKGFTLIELLGVIVVLSLLALIIVPSVTKSIQNGQKEADENTKNSIILSARNWLSDNRALVTSSYTVTVKTLQDEGYINEDVELPSKGCSLDGASVTIIKESEEPNLKYDYKLNLPDNCK